MSLLHFPFTMCFPYRVLPFTMLLTSPCSSLTMLFPFSSQCPSIHHIFPFTLCYPSLCSLLLNVLPFAMHYPSACCSHQHVLPFTTYIFFSSPCISLYDPLSFAVFFSVLLFLCKSYSGRFFVFLPSFLDANILCCIHGQHLLYLNA